MSSHAPHQFNIVKYRTYAERLYENQTQSVLSGDSTLREGNMTNKKANIAIVGAGVAGASAALYFANLGLYVTLFEKEASLVNGPPFCHLHAGGNLYREISDAQCVKVTQTVH